MFLNSIRIDFSISSTALRNLRSLMNTDEDILKILPGREKITHVHMEPYSARLHIGIKFSSSFSNVRIFSYGTQGLRPSLKGIVPFLHSIPVLDLDQYQVSSNTMHGNFSILVSTKASERDDLFKLSSKLRRLVLTWYQLPTLRRHIRTHGAPRVHRLRYSRL
jgi:hypothetical protein